LSFDAAQRVCACYNYGQSEDERPMLQKYLPILIFLGLSGVLGLALFTVGWIMGPRRPDAEKLSPYECGFEAFEDSRMRFDVRYYLVAIIFIVFDLEIAFFFPWAVSLGATGTFGLIAMLIFALVLVVALVYDYKKGALEWD
jgi:NADH-quinone oxidoreductase subunit A